MKKVRHLKKVYNVFKLNDIIFLKCKYIILGLCLYMLDIDFNQIIEMIEKRKKMHIKK